MNKAVTVGVHRKLLSELAGEVCVRACMCVGVQHVCPCVCLNVCVCECLCVQLNYLG